jgi:hypothetical protein
MALAKAYFDDSGDDIDPQHSACSIGGFLGIADSWSAFETEWNRLLKEELNIPFLHMRTFAHHLEPFDQLTDSDRIYILKALTLTIERCGLSGFGAVIRLPDLNRFNAERSRYLEARPLALYACMNAIYVEDPDRQVEIIIDRFDKPHSVIEKAKAYAAGHWSDDVSQNATCRSLIGQESYKTSPALQAADFIVYEIKKNVEDRRDWFDSTVGDPPETWEETEKKWLASKGRPYPYLRKSLAGLLETVPVTISIWDYRLLCNIDDKREGKWSA